MKCIWMLVNFGVDVNMKDEEGSILFYYSVWVGNIVVMKFFFWSGVNLDISNVNGEFFVDLIDDFDLVEMLVKYLFEERWKSLVFMK